jgi:superoxide dismutase, Fe-Mn family
LSDLQKELISEIDKIVGNKNLKESYVTEPKKFNLRTEFLSDTTKKLRQSSFERRVEALNRTSAKLDTVDKDTANPNNSDFRNLKVDEVHNLNASFFRALYFENISDLNSKITMDMISFLRLERDFGSFDEWQKDFIACSMSSRDGYSMTGYSIFLKRYINFVIDTEGLNVPIGVIPLIVLDVAEGAYYRDFQDDRKSYILAMMKEFNWEKIENRFNKAESISKVYEK